MQRILSLSSLTLLCLALVLPASAAAPSTLQVNLQQQNGSGESGSATLTQVGGDVQVVVAVDGAPAAAQPMHIHTGTCSDLGGVAYGLTPLAGGKSTSTVKGVTIAQLLAKPTAINVHQSKDNMGKYVACGNITAKSSM